MSLPQSSLSRSTPVSVPASQNTAPVIKFRCLYTHDIRRKAKRWQDGYLKYHTFNKRAMVYDGAGNFIGDHHWRESHDIQDGDELELDKGVMIQVSECLETTQTDISVLFEKRKATQESPPQPKADAIPLSSSVSVSYLNQSPLPRSVKPFNPLKPLNDILGIQKGPIGRSVTPQSPYEQCHRQQRPVQHIQFAPTQPQEERATKRQRLNSQSDILQNKSTNVMAPHRSEVIEIDCSPCAKPPQKAATLTTSKRATVNPPVNPRMNPPSIQTSVDQPLHRAQPRQLGSRAIDNSRAFLSPARQSGPGEASNVKRLGPSIQQPSVASRVTVDEPRVASRNQPEKTPKPTNVPRQTASSGDDPGFATPCSNAQTSHKEPISQPSHKNQPMNTLRLSNEKPRPKLLYRGSLPKDSGEVQRTSNPDGSEDSLDDTDHDFPFSSSALAVFDEPIPTAPAPADVVACGSVHNMNPDSGQCLVPKLSRSQIAQSRALHRIPTHASVYGPSASPAGLELHEDMIDESLFTSSPLESDPCDPDPCLTVQRSPIARSHSDINHNVSDLGPLMSDPADLPPNSSAVKRRLTTAVKQGERVFRKSHSDTNTLRNRESANNGVSRPLATTGPPREQRDSNSGAGYTESGPWTAHALDFFDWWPPGRPRPA